MTGVGSAAESPATRRAFCLCAYSLHLRRDGRKGAAHDAGMEATTKLQKAGRAFLLRLVAEYGPRGAARVLRALADESQRARTASPTGNNTASRKPPLLSSHPALQLTVAKPLGPGFFASRRQCANTMAVYFAAARRSKHPLNRSPTARACQRRMCPPETSSDCSVLLVRPIQDSTTQVGND
jgi:hypothetical protein